MKEEEWNPWGQDFGIDGKPKGMHSPDLAAEWKDVLKENDTNPRPGDRVVEIWGKAAISEFLRNSCLVKQIPWSLARNGESSGFLFAERPNVMVKKH